MTGAEFMPCPYHTAKDGEKRAPRPPLALHLVASDGRATGMPGLCRECGCGFTGKRNTREFCSPYCRSRFNNRRMIRSAVLYDLVMTWRWDRGDGKESAARNLLGQAALLFKPQDDRERDGRRSFDDLHKRKERNPRIAAKIVAVNVAGRRRT